MAYATTRRKKSALRKGLLGFLGSIAIVSSACAADDNPSPQGGYKEGTAPINTWTGLYAGGQGGGIWGNQNLFFPGPDTSTHINVDGGIVGGQLGAQYQFYNNFVLGAEVYGIGSTFADGSTTCSHGVTTCFAAVRASIGVAGRAGYALGNFLPYVKGGFADTTMRSNFPAPLSGYNESKEQGGWVAGGGLDYAITQSFILGVDYSHIETNSATYSGVAGAGIARNVDASIDTVTVRFGWKYMPAAQAALK